MSMIKRSLLWLGLGSDEAYEGYVDIFDGGPTVTARTDQLKTLRETRPMEISRCDLDIGDRVLIESFRDRINARLMLLPPHAPQFRRNRERINRDAERENVRISWDLGYDEEPRG